MQGILKWFKTDYNVCISKSDTGEHEGNKDESRHTKKEIYQGVYARDNSMNHKHKEGLIVCVPHTIIHPDTVVILASWDTSLTTLSSKIHQKKKPNQ